MDGKIAIAALSDMVNSEEIIFFGKLANHVDRHMHIFAIIY
jgi:hypothetical protein